MSTYNFDDLEADDLRDELYEELVPGGNLRKITALISAGCDIHYGYPLLVAVTAGDLDIVKLLVESGVDVNKFDPEDEETALFRAMFNGHQHIVEYLEPITEPHLRDLAKEKLKLNSPRPPIR
jgi:ankyrin repeat protein